MANNTLLSSLASRISPGVRILQDAHVARLHSLLGALVELRREDALCHRPVRERGDVRVVHIVRESVEASVPFVSASGGHSPWTIGEDGIIVDLSRFKGVEADVGNGVATVKGGRRGESARGSPSSRR
ncbi:hypothetical protein B0H14DRAFT_225870 [Mycena olivaceomarginata]|nr:hypothetical protein B0H14DRAFT_225870 [Mycena olivaceomarginata]